ncbi:hypothetical protein O9992_17395 [Vibrio lentus]|nr:hypothetical protein [Vibrio lentus]
MTFEPAKQYRNSLKEAAFLGHHLLSMTLTQRPKIGRSRNSVSQLPQNGKRDRRLRQKHL